MVPQDLAQLVGELVAVGSDADLYPLDAAEVWDILEMNRNGEKPESLCSEPEPYVPEFVTAVGDDSISRFDAPKRKRSRGGKNRGRGGRNKGRQEGGQKPPKSSD